MTHTHDIRLELQQVCKPTGTVVSIDWEASRVGIVVDRDTLSHLAGYIGQEDAIRLATSEPFGNSGGLPELKPPKTPLSIEQVEHGSRLLAAWTTLFPTPEMAPKMRVGGGLYYRLPEYETAEIDLDYVNHWGKWVFMFSVTALRSPFHLGNSTGPSCETADADALPDLVKKRLERYIRDYQAGSKKGPERYENGRYVQDYRDADLPAVPWCRWVLERMAK